MLACQRSININKWLIKEKTDFEVLERIQAKLNDFWKEGPQQKMECQKKKQTNV
jgi:hypothetical protein